MALLSAPDHTSSATLTVARLGPGKIPRIMSRLPVFSISYNVAQRYTPHFGRLALPGNGFRLQKRRNQGKKTTGNGISAEAGTAPSTTEKLTDAVHYTLDEVRKFLDRLLNCSGLPRNDRSLAEVKYQKNPWELPFDR